MIAVKIFEQIKVKPSDPFGYSGGSEAGPGAEWINDCCVLNVDEKDAEGNLGKSFMTEFNRRYCI